MDDYLSPDWASVVLLTIDTQRDFTLPGAAAEVAGTAEVVPKIRRLLREFRRQRRPIVHAVRIYRADGTNADLCRRREIEQGRPVVLPDSDGVELMDALKPAAEIRLDDGRLLAGGLQRVGPDEWIMYKPRWGAFYNTPLEEHLAGLGANTVVVCGCNFPNCPRSTVYEASERDLRVVLVSDATSGLYDRGVLELENIGVNLMGAEEILEESRAVASEVV